MSMKNIIKHKGKRILSAFLCMLMVLAALPMSAFAWTGAEGVSCTSSFGDKYVGSDGQNYHSQSSYTVIVYDESGGISTKTISAGNARRKYLLSDGSGSHQVYCVESGVSYTTGNSYVSKNGNNSSYFRNLPTEAQFGILDLGKQLQPIGMLVVLDSILNRITQNRAKGRNTFIFIDEIYLLFQHEYSANFLFTLWKRVRKYGAYCTGITQNVDDLLQSHTARTMLANSEFIIMLNQASTDRIELAKLLNISDLQMSYITNVGAGQGLLKVGSSLVPFVNKFPRNTELYKLMTTKFGEV